MDAGNFRDLQVACLFSSGRPADVLMSADDDGLIVLRAKIGDGVVRLCARVCPSQCAILRRRDFSATPADCQRGDWVTLCGMTSRPWLNGRLATVSAPGSCADERLTVRPIGGQETCDSLSSEPPPAAWVPGLIVRVTDIRSRRFGEYGELVRLVEESSAIKSQWWAVAFDRDGSARHVREYLRKTLQLADDQGLMPANIRVRPSCVEWQAGFREAIPEDCVCVCRASPSRGWPAGGAAAPSASEPAPGDEVLLNGIDWMPELNGCHAVVMQADTCASHAIVRAPGRQPSENLYARVGFEHCSAVWRHDLLLDPVDCVKDDIVELCGFDPDLGLNGLCGSVQASASDHANGCLVVHSSAPPPYGSASIPPAHARWRVFCRDLVWAKVAEENRRLADTPALRGSR